MAKPTKVANRTKSTQPDTLANLKKQLNEHALEIFVALLLALIGFGFINSFGKYILIIVLFSSLLVIWLHDKPKIFPWVMLLIGISLGIVVGNIVALNNSKSNLTTENTKITPVPTATSTPPSLKIILDAQWLKLNSKLRIVDNNATLECSWLYEGIGIADCTLDVIGKDAVDFSLREEEDYLFYVYDKSYYLTLLDTKPNEIYITISQVPPELLPMPTVTPSPYPTSPY